MSACDNISLTVTQAAYEIGLNRNITVGLKNDCSVGVAYQTTRILIKVLVCIHIDVYL